MRHLVLTFVIAMAAAPAAAFGPDSWTTRTTPPMVFSSISGESFIAAVGGTPTILGRRFRSGGRKIIRVEAEMAGTFTQVALTSYSHGNIEITVAAGLLDVGTWNLYVTTSDAPTSRRLIPGLTLDVVLL